MNDDREIILQEIVKYAKQRVRDADLRHADRTAVLFMQLLEHLGDMDRAWEVNDYYDEVWG